MQRCIEARLLEPRESIEVDEITRKLWNCGVDVGAVLVYIGRVKGMDVKLVLEAPDAGEALRELEAILEGVVKRYEKLRGALLYTYVGERLPGEPVAYIAVAAVDRYTALKALEELVNAYKSTRSITHREVAVTPSRS